MGKGAVITREKGNPLEGLTINNLRFLEEYARSGNITKSWQKVYKIANPVAAYASAFNFLKKHPDSKRAILEIHGIDYSKVASALNDGFEARKMVVTKQGVADLGPDALTRVKTAEVADRLLSGDSPNVKIGNQLNVQIIAKDGEFKVTEG